MPDDEEVATMYSDAYFAEGGEWVCGYWLGSYAENEANLRAEARDVIATLGRPGRLLEIGCAGGFFLDEAQSAGFEVSGIDLNGSQVESARALGLQVTCAAIETADLPMGCFDFVIAQDVLEHVRDVRTFMNRARRLLRSGGELVIRGPLEADTRSAIFQAVRRLRRQPLILDRPPFHVQGFTRASFQQLCHLEGMHLISLEAIPDRYPLRDWALREIAGQAVEWTGYAVDRIFGRGSFMVGRAGTLPERLSPGSEVDIPSIHVSR